MSEMALSSLLRHTGSAGRTSKDVSLRLQRQSWRRPIGRRHH